MPNQNDKPFLRPCRFCGSKDIDPPSRRFLFVTVGCRKCGARGPIKLTHNESVIAWNDTFFLHGLAANDVDALRKEIARLSKEVRKLNDQLV